MTTYQLDEVVVRRDATVYFAPTSIGDALVTVTIGRVHGGDGSGTLEASSGVRVVLGAMPSGGAFVFDSHYQTSSGVLDDGASVSGSIEYTVHWSRLYQLSVAAMLSSVHVVVESGGELVCAGLLTVQQVSLTVAGRLTGVRELALGEGARVSLEASGHTNGSAASTYTLEAMYIDGRSAEDGSANAQLTLGDGVSLVTLASHIVKGVVVVEGSVHLESALINVTSGGLIDGTGGSSYGARSGPGYPITHSMNGRAAGSHGGVCGLWCGASNVYGSTFEPASVGSSGWSAKGGGAVRLMADVLVLDGEIRMDGASVSQSGGGAGGSAWLTVKVLRGSGGSVNARGGSGQGNGNSGYWQGGSAGGGGGRVALYCDQSEYGSSMLGYGGVPMLRAHGGDDGGSSARQGGTGTVYADCGDANNTLIIDGHGCTRPSANACCCCVVCLCAWCWWSCWCC